MAKSRSNRFGFFSYPIWTFTGAFAEAKNTVSLLILLISDFQGIHQISSKFNDLTSLTL